MILKLKINTKTSKSNCNNKDNNKLTFKHKIQLMIIIKTKRNKRLIANYLVINIQSIILKKILITILHLIRVVSIFLKLP